MKKIWFLSIVALSGGMVSAAGALAQTASLSRATNADNEFAVLEEHARTSLKGVYHITWDDLVNSPALKNRGGSHLFHFYLFGVIGPLDRLLRDDSRIPEEERAPPEFKKQFAHLCRDPECGEGLDLGKITPEALYFVLNYASRQNSPFITINISGESLGESPETVLFLQEYPSSPGMGPAVYRHNIANKEYETPSDSPHIKNVKEKIEGIENLREFVVNMPHQFGLEGDQHQDINLFMALGRIIRKRNLNVRIIGRCGTACANYLLPAARTVIIEPYGYIYTEGSMRGFYTGGRIAASIQRDYQLKKLREEWLLRFRPAPASGVSVSNPYDLFVAFISERMLRLFGLEADPERPVASSEVSEKQQQKAVSMFMELLTKWGQSQWGEDILAEFDGLLEGYRSRVGRSPEKWNSEDVKRFVTGLANEDQGHFLEKLALFIKIFSDEETIKWNSYLENMEWLVRHTIPYHREVTGTLLSQISSYSYESLLDLISHLVQDTFYESVFSVLKTYYAVPESEKPRVVFLSADLLRGLGMNVRGKNNWRVLAEKSKDKALSLDERTVENCQFFKSLYLHLDAVQTGQLPSPVFTKDTFTACALKE